MTYFIQCHWGLPSQYRRSMPDKTASNAVDTGGLREDDQSERVALTDCADLLTLWGRGRRAALYSERKVYSLSLFVCSIQYLLSNYKIYDCREH